MPSNTPWFTTAALICAGSAAFAQSVTVETFTGPVELEANPQTVVALDLAAMDSLTALGVPVAGGPQVTPPPYLAEVMAQTPAVGTLFEPDFEKLAIMAPDLIIAGGRSQTQVEPLGNIAQTIDMTIGTDLVADGKARLASYGQLFDKGDEAQALLDELDAAIAEARANAADAGDALILLTNGGKVSAYGPGSRFGWLHGALGLTPAADLAAEGGSDSHGQAVSFEYIAELNPDWIFVIDRGAAIGREGEAAQVTLDNPLVAGTDAGQAGHIVYLESGPMYLSGGGIQSLMGTIGEVNDALSAANGS